MTVDSLIVLVVAWLATVRLYRLFVHDDITSYVRTLALRLYYWGAGENDNLRGRFWDSMYRGASCPWCIWFWAGLVVVWTGLVWGDTLYWQVPAGALAVNYLVGTTISKTEDE